MQPSQHNPTDAPGNIIASILVTKAAVATFNISPFLLGGYIDHIGLSASQASRVLAVEIFSLALSNAAACLWLHRFSYRSLAQRLLLALIALNVSCIFSTGYDTLLAQRAAVGVVEGALLAVGFGLLGTTSHPERNFGFYFAASLTVGAINVRILPLFMETAGVTGLFTNLSLYAVIALAGSFWLRRGGFSAQEPAPSHARPADAAGAPRLAIPLVTLVSLLVANYIYFVGQGAVWSFFERLGQQNSLPFENIASALSLSLLVGVAGGLAASWLDVKLGRLVPLLVAIAMACASVGILWNSPGVVAFAIAGCLFNFANNLGHPYILGIASTIDRSGRMTIFSGALHTAGQATGPFIAGLLVSPPIFTNALWVGVVMFGLTVVLVAPLALLDARKAPRPARAAT